MKSISQSNVHIYQIILLERLAGWLAVILAGHVTENLEKSIRAYFISGITMGRGGKANFFVSIRIQIL